MRELLLDSCENVEITDFGFARLMKVGETFCGPRAYLAPEILREQQYDAYQLDLWSAKIVLYVLYTIITWMMHYGDKNDSISVKSKGTDTPQMTLWRGLSYFTPSYQQFVIIGL
uniref:Protein kinase domain-containing protein n=1 Tax=Elaeophora elaphi TaxID=1147741 RepID=A0A0R3RTN6_9BILA